MEIPYVVRPKTYAPGHPPGPPGKSHLHPLREVPGLPLPRTRIPLLEQGWGVPAGCRSEDWPYERCGVLKQVAIPMQPSPALPPLKR